jgi:Ser/Thr protein kinase RdoA (MazF antagonist)
MEIRSEFVNQAFVEGYQGARPLNAEELNGGPLFRVARDLVMSSTYAILINRVGPVPGFDGDFQPFTQLARQHLQYAELD